MSQYYPQRSPFYPPEHNPEDDYIYDEDDYEVEEDEDGGAGGSLLQRSLIFLAGGCLVFLCMSCCVLSFVSLWTLDPSSLLIPAPAPGSELGLSFNDPAFPDESVVNEQNTKLSIKEVNRNAAGLPAVPTVEGREIIMITIELVNLGDTDVDFNERDFLLLNGFEEAYQPLAGADVGEGALGRGTLPPGEGLEGRLAFEIIAGERDLVLTWESPGGTRYIFLE
jgi:hypothetical protein